MTESKIVNADCLEWLPTLPAASADLVFVDPPFNIGYEYDSYSDSREADEYLQWCRDWLQACLRVLKPAGTLWLASGDNMAAELKVMATRELELHCRSWVIWYYTFGVNCKNKFSRSHTHLFHFVRDPKQFTFNREAILVPSARQAVYKDKRGASAGRLPDDTWILRPAQAPEAFAAADDDVWHFSRVCGTFSERQPQHKCQMPELMLERIVLACSNAGDVVVDPMCGTGTAVVAAHKHRRIGLGCDLSPNYTATAADRLASTTPIDPA